MHHSRPLSRSRESGDLVNLDSFDDGVERNQVCTRPAVDDNQHRDLLRAFNNTEQFQNIIYEDATNENRQSRVSYDPKLIGSDSSPYKHDVRAFSLHSKETGSF